MEIALPFRRARISETAGHRITPCEQLRMTRIRLAQNRAHAITQLGESWVLHPNYRPDMHPFHSPGHKESVVMRRVADTARAEGRL